MDKIKSWIDKHVIANGITVFEYIVWWIMRIALLSVLAYIFKIKFIDEGNFSIRIVQIAGCFLATFTVPIVRKLFFFIKPIKNMTLRMQTWINMTAFVASFFGQGLDAVLRRPQGVARLLRHEDDRRPAGARQVLPRDRRGPARGASARHHHHKGSAQLQGVASTQGGTQ